MKKGIINIGCIFIIGWAVSSIFDIKDISTNLKPLTAVCFFGVSIILMLLSKKTIEMHEAKQSIVTGIATGILAMMLSVMFLFGYESMLKAKFLSIENLPTLSASICFMIFCIYAFVFVYGHSTHKKRILFTLALLIFIPAATATIGRTFNIQQLTFYIDDFDTGMRTQTAILFIVLSALMTLKTKELYA